MHFIVCHFKTPIMKLTKFTLLSLLIFGSLAIPFKASAQDDDEVSFSNFQNDLSPYGTWMNSARFGRVWIYNDASFKPYATNGHWDYTNYGWSWVSDFNWGWAPFHYGRWEYDQMYGWMWIPGYQWASAWVSWSQNDGYYGWAPLGYGLGINVSFNAIPYNRWNFIPRQYMGSEDFYNHYSYGSVQNNYFRNSVTINNYYNGSEGRFTRGPERRDVERYTNNRIEERHIGFRDRLVNRDNNNARNNQPNNNNNWGRNNNSNNNGRDNNGNINGRTGINNNGSQNNNNNPQQTVRHMITRGDNNGVNSPTPIQATRNNGGNNNNNQQQPGRNNGNNSNAPSQPVRDNNPRQQNGFGSNRQNELANNNAMPGNNNPARQQQEQQNRQQQQNQQQARQQQEQQNRQQQQNQQQQARQQQEQQNRQQQQNQQQQARQQQEQQNRQQQQNQQQARQQQEQQNRQQQQNTATATQQQHAEQRNVPTGNSQLQRQFDGGNRRSGRE